LIIFNFEISSQFRLTPQTVQSSSLPHAGHTSDSGIQLADAYSGDTKPESGRGTIAEPSEAGLRATATQRIEDAGDIWKNWRAHQIMYSMAQKTRDNSKLR
jgi:hypothetical protein